MSKKLAFAAILLSASFAIGTMCFGQESKSPVTKEEILRWLKPAPGKRVDQRDLTGEIVLRGVAFPVDEKTLEDLRKAGARSFLIDAIRQSFENASRPLSQPTAETPAKIEPVAEKAGNDAEPPALTEEERRVAMARLPLLEQARVHAGEFLDELPNFIATQFITRSARGPGDKDWQAQDKLEVELTYNPKTGEKFKLVRVNDRPAQSSYDDLQGTTSTGQFGSMLGALFAAQSQAEFKEVRRETFRSRPTVVYDFRVKKAFSSNQITDKPSGRTINAAYSGTVWIEIDSARVLRLEQSAEDIQRGFPVTMAESAVEYDWAKIGNQRYLLPIYAEVILGNDAERTYSRNVIELRNYHMFETELKILPEKDQE
jgi:hypothetical protein